MTPFDVTNYSPDPDYDTDLFRDGYVIPNRRPKRHQSTLGSPVGPRPAPVLAAGRPAVVDYTDPWVARFVGLHRGLREVIDLVALLGFVPKARRRRGR